MDLQNKVGFKYFKVDDDGVHMLRLVHVKRSWKDKGMNPTEVTVLDYDTNEKRKIRFAELKENYTPLTPDAVATAVIAKVQMPDGSMYKDVFVTADRFNNMKIGDAIGDLQWPFCVCRQSVTDFFHNMAIADESEMLVGVSVNQLDCPSNFDYRNMFAASEMDYIDFVNFYMTDTVDDILSMINVKKFDEVLEGLFKDYVKTIKDPASVFKKEVGGWCRDLSTLLHENNFQMDLDEMLSILSIDFKLSDYFVEKDLPTAEGVKYISLTDDCAKWLSSIYEENIKDVTVLEYDHDINLGDFKNGRYGLIRDNTNQVYVCLYTTTGEEYVKDLQIDAAKPDFSTTFKLKFYNKYNDTNK
jgi:hypothetical protein